MLGSDCEHGKHFVGQQISIHTEHGTLYGTTEATACLPLTENVL